MKATRAEPEIKKQKVVVLGTGWVGTRFLKQGKDVLYEVVLISPQSNSAFNAPSVTTVEPHSNIVNKENVDECFTIDSQSKKVVQYCRGHGKQEEFEEEYDYLVIAMGLNTTTDLGVVEHCNFLKEVEDARKIHRFFVDAFEKYKAILPSLTDEEITTGLWHFVVVDGRKEFAAELHNFVNEDLVKDAREYVKITSLEAAGRIETMFDKRITEFTEAGVTVDWSAETGFDSAIRDFMKNVRQEDVAIFNKEEGDNFGTRTVKELQEAKDDSIEQSIEELNTEHEDSHQFRPTGSSSRGVRDASGRTGSGTVIISLVLPQAGAVIIASDRQETDPIEQKQEPSYKLIEIHQSMKIRTFKDRFLVGCSGTAGYCDDFMDKLRDNAQDFRTDFEAAMKEYLKTLVLLKKKWMKEIGNQESDVVVQAILGGVDFDNVKIWILDGLKETIMGSTAYKVIGSGRVSAFKEIALGYSPDLTVHEGVELCLRSLHRATLLDLNIAGQMDVMIMQKPNVKGGPSKVTHLVCSTLKFNRYIREGNAKIWPTGSNSLLPSKTKEEKKIFVESLKEIKKKVAEDDNMEETLEKMVKKMKRRMKRRMKRMKEMKRRMNKVGMTGMMGRMKNVKMMNVRRKRKRDDNNEDKDEY